MGIELFDRILIGLAVGSIIGILFSINMNLFKIYSTQRMIVLTLDRILNKEKKD